MSIKTTLIKGRGAQINPVSRFEQYRRDEVEGSGVATKYFNVNAKTIVNKVDSPDIPLPYSLNPYQGCEHGCVYCYARNTHPYWGFSAGTEFEQNILIKHEAPSLLRKFLSNKKYHCQPIMLSGNTDCYQPAEQEFKLTRQLLEICLEYNQPVGIITKNALVIRDLDILIELNKKKLVHVVISLTSLDEKLRLLLEPRTATISKRLNAIFELSRHEIPVMVMMAPVIPALTDTEIFDMVKACKDAGAYDVHYTILRLNGDVEPIFIDWARKTFPDRADKIINLTAECHGGTVQDNRFQKRMKGEGKYAELIRNQFQLARKKYGMPAKEYGNLDCSLFRQPGSQMVFDFDS